MASGSWFDQQAFQPAQVGGIAVAPPRTGTVDPSGMMLLGGSPAAGQDPQAYFNSLFPGPTLTPQQLAAKEAQLQAGGMRLLGPNAAGQRTKVMLPDGRVMDVIGGAGAGHNTRQWLHAGGPGAPGAPAGAPAAPPNTPYNPANSKGFQFRMGEGLKAIQRSAAAKGTLLTGGTLKDLNTFAQGLASDEFGADYNRLAGLASVGGSAASNMGQLGVNTAGQIASGYQGIGNAQAAGTVGSGNAWSGALGNLGNIAQAGLYNYSMNQPAATPPWNPYAGRLPASHPYYG